MAENKKKFKDTKLFATIKAVAPQALDVVTDVAASVYPPLGVVNTIVDNALGSLGQGDVESKKILEEAKADYQSEMEMYYADLQNARDMYKETDHTQADKIADNVIKYNLIIVLVMVVIQVLVIMYIEGQVAAVITGVVGTVTGALLQERNTVINFFFGSSSGSKDKDKK